MPRFYGVKAFSVLLLLFSPSQPVAMQRHLYERRGVDPSWTTDPLQFYRMAFHSSVLVGDTIYLDGGDTNWLDSSDNMRGWPLNSTRSLDVSTSWSPSELRLISIDKGDCPVLNRPNLWPSPDDKSYYSFNGDVSQAGLYYRDPPRTPELWKFTPKRPQSEAWELVEQALSPVEIQSQGARVASNGSSAYILGGFANWRTTQAFGYDLYAESSVDGIISYNSKSTTWQNQSMAGFVPSGWWFDGETHFVSNLGGRALVFALGGVTAEAGPTLFQPSLLQFDQVGVFDPATGRWLKQTTTGDIPPARRPACSVGVPGDNGTYEIFIHGGAVSAADEFQQSTPQPDIQLDQVWVLSLPSFTWYKSSYEPVDSRMLHTCHVPGTPPRREMIAIGGYVADLEYAIMPRDPWVQGLGVLDLTEMRWKESYNASAARYETPSVVKAGIAKNGSHPPTWDDPMVAVWITGEEPKNTTDVPSTGTTHAKGTNVGAIAGGVVGGVLGLTVCIGVLWFVIRQRKRTRSEKQGDRFEKSELAGQSIRRKPLRTEKAGGTQELYADPKHEMDGSAARHELPSTSVRSNTDRRGERFEMP